MPKKLFGLVVEAQCLTCVAWPQGRGTETSTRFSTTAGEILHLSIFNPTKVMAWINDFLAAYSLERSKAIIALDGDGLHEYIVEQQEGQEVGQEGERGGVVVDHYVWALCSLTHGRLYKAGIPYHVRAQYHLLALGAAVDLVRITTANLACYHAASLKGIDLGNDEILASLKNMRDAQGFSYFDGLYMLAQ